MTLNCTVNRHRAPFSRIQDTTAALQGDPFATRTLRYRSRQPHTLVRRHLRPWQFRTEERTMRTNTPLFATSHIAPGVESTKDNWLRCLRQIVPRQALCQPKNLSPWRTLPPTVYAVMGRYASSVTTHPQDGASPHNTRTHRHAQIFGKPRTPCNGDLLLDVPTASSKPTCDWVQPFTQNQCTFALGITGLSTYARITAYGNESTAHNLRATWSHVFDSTINPDVPTNRNSAQPENDVLYGLTTSTDGHTSTEDPKDALPLYSATATTFVSELAGPSFPFISALSDLRMTTIRTRRIRPSSTLRRCIFRQMRAPTSSSIPVRVLR